MNGLDLSQNFFEEIAKPLFEQNLPDILEKAAFGIAGEGSECFGFDDGFSRDHDFGAGFCIWLPREEWKTWLEPTEKLLENLPASYCGFPVRLAKTLRGGRLGPMSTERFYEQFTGCAALPQTWREWIDIPEHFLATCTNGKVFLDKSKRFSSLRQYLLNYYPEDVRLKKIAARCAAMAQAGQYNAMRSLQRNQDGALLFAVSRFCHAAISLAFLLNRQYMPYYKWAHHAVKNLPFLGNIVHSSVLQLIGAAFNPPQDTGKVFEIIETLCCETRMELNRLGLSRSTDNWLMTHAHEIQAKITVPELKKLSVFQDGMQHAVEH